MNRPLAFFLAMFALPWPAIAGDAEIHYSPAENLERIDVELLHSARRSIDMAAYALTDWQIVGALVEARHRGVAIRIALDPSQRHALDKLGELADAIRLKRPGPYMHLKSYAIDGDVLRAGSANFSPSGLKAQDNELIVIRSADVAGKFETRFAAIWAAAVPIADTGRATGAPASPRPAGEAASGPNGCAIKGNVNRKGERIYHDPGDRDYARVTMDDPKKRWFCSDDEARGAGWRHAGER